METVCRRKKITPQGVAHCHKGFARCRRESLVGIVGVMCRCKGRRAPQSGALCIAARGSHTVIREVHDIEGGAQLVLLIPHSRVGAGALE